jgi:thioredoxin 1
MLNGRVQATLLAITVSLLMASCGQNGNSQGLTDQGETTRNDAVQEVSTESTNTHKVTFIEIGSKNCIPCKMMQPVMDKVESTYGNQVKVVFYDVWTREGRPYGQKYNIRVIPTQVFLDKDGKEYFRHEGFFPFEEVEKILKKQGVR